MTVNWVAFLEISLVLGLAIGWGVWELLSLRRYRRRAEAEALQSTPGSGDPERRCNGFDSAASDDGGPRAPAP